MSRLLARLCIFSIVMSMLVASAPLHAGEAEDEEAIAAREKKARDEREAAKKGKKAPDTQDDGKSPFGTDTDPDAAIDLSKLTGKKESPPAAKPKEAMLPPNAPGKSAGPAKPSTPTKPGDIAGVNAAAALCPLCKGMTILPLLPYKPYTKFEGQTAPNPEYPAEWKWCEKCQKSGDPKAIIEDMKDRQARLADKHKQFEESTGGKPMKQFETPFLTVHSQLTPGANAPIAKALEKCAGILINNSKSMVLCTTRPDTDDLVILADPKSYDTYIDNTMTKADKTTLEMFKKSMGFNHAHFALFKMTPNASAESHAVSDFGTLTIGSATDHKAKPWLTEGFGAYCENVTLGTNMVYHFVYEMNQVKFGKNWNEDMKKCFKEGKLKPWMEIFQIDLSHMKPFEYLTCYSIVSFLIRNDPVRFDNFILNIRAGDDSVPAIEKAYGMKIKDLQSAWVQWVQTQK